MCFSRKDIASEIFSEQKILANRYLNAPNSRCGWLLQQLIKLYAPLVIPDISPNVLVFDSDVVLLQPMSFMTSVGTPLFTPAVELTREYFEHAAALLPGLRRVHRAFSGIAHHMLFQKPIIEDLFALIEKEHQVEAWKAICRAIRPATVYRSAMSEYEIYFNFVLLRTHQGSIRPLRWANIGAFISAPHYVYHRLIYVASHHWLRELEQQLGYPQLNLFN